MKIRERLIRALGGHNRAEMEHLQRGYAVARTNRMTLDWAVDGVTIDQDLRNDLRATRARSREQYQNSEWVRKYVRLCQGNIIGPEGMFIKFRGVRNGEAGTETVLDTESNRVLQDLWYEFGRAENLCVDEKTCWRDAEELSLSTEVIDGESFTRIIIDEGSPFGMRLQFIDPSQCDTEHNTPPDSSGREIRMGVEKDGSGRVLAYHFLTRPPNDLHFGPGYGERVRISAYEIVHQFIPEFVGQTRGIPWATTALPGLRQLTKADEAAVVALRANACHRGYFVPQRDEMGNYHYNPAEGQQPSTEIKPMTTEVLPAGLTYQGADPKYPNGEFIDSAKHFLRRFCAGLGVCYHSLSGDLEGVNFSSSRVGLQDERNEWMRLQRIKATGWHEKILARFILIQLLRGQVPGAGVQDFARLNYVSVQGRRWEWVDPTKEISAKRDEMSAGLTSPQRVVAAMGRGDIEEIYDEIAEAQTAAEKRKLNFQLTEKKPEAPAPEI